MISDAEHVAVLAEMLSMDFWHSDLVRRERAAIERAIEVIASLRIQVSLREREREAWRACAHQLYDALDCPLYIPLRKEAEDVYERLSYPDTDNVWPE